MPDGTDVTSLNYATEAERANCDFYCWDRTNPEAQFKVKAEDLGGGGGGGGLATDLLMSTARILGRSTAGIGAVEEITVGTGLSLAGGVLSATGGGGGGNAWNLQWGPLDNERTATNYATLDTRNNHPVLDFDTTTQEAAVFSGVMPDDYGGGGITVSVWCTLTSATSGTVGWLVSIERMDASSLDIDADSFATPQTITAATVPATSGQLLKMSVNMSNGAAMDGLVAGEMFRIKIERDVANDTATGDAELLRVMMVEQ